MSSAGFSGLDPPGRPPFGQRAPFGQGAPFGQEAPFGQGAPGQGVPGGPGDSHGVADFFGGGGGPGFGGDDYFGGGGFLHSGNFLTQAQQPSGFQLSLIPVKIAHVFKAWMEDASSLQVSFFPSGPLLHLVKLVGALDVPPRETLEASLQSARLQFNLDDFSGRMECEYTVGDELTEYKQNQILDALCCGGLVTIFGSINLLGKSEPSLRVHAIRQTQSAAEFVYHESQCQAAYLRLKHPNEDPEGNAAGQQQPLQQQQQQQQPFGTPQRLQGAVHSGQAALMPFG